jgi:hypothetical protein
MQNPRMIPQSEFWEVLKLSCFSTCIAESIGISVYCLWESLVEKLFMGYFFTKKTPVAPEAWHSELFRLFNWAEPIDVLEVRIGQNTLLYNFSPVQGEKLYNRVYWLEIPIGGVYPQQWPQVQKFGCSVALLEFFRQGAPIELTWAKIAWTVERLLTVLFNLEIPMPGPNSGVLGELNPLEVFGSVGTLKRHFLA